MNDPLKIIWKYKNKNRRVQNNIYIYIGNFYPELDKILNKIKDLSLYDTLITLSIDEYNKIKNIYGNNWIYKFFVSQHIKYTLNNIENSKLQQDELKNKYGDEIIKQLLQERDSIKKLIYNYESLIKMEYDKQENKKKKREIGLDEFDNVDFILQKQKTKIYQQGGMIEDDTDIIESKNIIDELEPDELIEDEEKERIDIEELYKETEMNDDDNNKKTEELLKKAFEKDDVFDNKYTNLTLFDENDDDNIYDGDLKNTFKKYYVRSQYLYKDDTIKRIKEKIGCSLKISNKFGNDLIIIPTRQYLWSEYVYDNTIQKVTLGHRWMRRNILLPIDIEPNKIKDYEELTGNIKILNDLLKRHGTKVHYEDEHNNILYDYSDYITNNEIYMIDIYNELGKDYVSNYEYQQNIQNTYLKIYFPKIKDELKQIIDFLNNKDKIEEKKISQVYDTLYNDLIMDNEVMNLVGETSIRDNYKDIFKERYITHADVHLTLRFEGENKKIDLRRIFDNFETNESYQFIQYQTAEGFIYKINDAIKEYTKDKLNILYKWFENSPYGLSFKVIINESNFIVINLSENGKIEYKNHWRERDMANIDDIKNTYKYIRNLITKINSEKNKINIQSPDDSEFRYAYINTIQRFELPEKYNINHNDLSDFCIYFYPYISLIIEPPKRIGKLKKGEAKSKFGTYLKYKRVSKYDNSVRLEQRIIYFMKNYEFSDQTLANELSKQFNILVDRALEEIKIVKAKYPTLKKTRKVLKKLENIPKYKPAGIEIDIQGKQRDNYKIRISGARDKEQLDRMLLFINVLLHLYIETYLLKKPERQILIQKLKKLTNIAKRQHKVDAIVDYVKEAPKVKQITSTDKLRLGFRPDKGQNQWTRSCQNSGDDKRRRPTSTTGKKISELVKLGYKYNKKLDNYEKETYIKDKNKKQKVILRTLKLPELDNEGKQTGDYIYYTCDPEDNGEYAYVGFLTKSLNPYGFCMPCCYKKNMLESKNKNKKEFFEKCLQQGSIKVESKTIGDILYILQDTNKIQEGRLSLLPQYLDIFFNKMLNKEKKMKNHYLLESITGYFCKLGVKNDEPFYLNSLSQIFDMSIDEIKLRMITKLENDKKNLIYLSLCNGDIANQFENKTKFIEYIKTATILDPYYINDLLSIPDVMSKSGLNILIYNKKTTIIQKVLEKETVRTDFYLECVNYENYGYISDPDRKTIFLIHDDKIYYPIIMILKPDKKNKEVDIIKIFEYGNTKNNIVFNNVDFYNKNCEGLFIDDILNKKSSLPARLLYNILSEFEKRFNIKYQIIDSYNKCKYIITNEGMIIPTRPSGIIYNIEIISSLDKFLNDFKVTYKNIMHIYNKSQHRIPIKPKSIYYNSKSETEVTVISIITITNDEIPCIPTKVDIATIVEMKLSLENKPINDIINNYISKGVDEKIIDKRIENIQEDKYKRETYELFRYEFGEYLATNEKLKNTILKIIDSNLDNLEKKNKLKSLLFNIIDKSLNDEFIQSQTQSETETSYSLDTSSENIQHGGFVNIINNHPDYNNYIINNTRSLCNENNDKTTCIKNIQCTWKNSCKFSLPKELIIIFVEKICEELVLNEIKANELLKRYNYYVSDIVDITKFSELPGQRIFKSNTANLKKVLDELFGKTNLPSIGKRKGGKLFNMNNIDYEKLNDMNKIQETNTLYIQKIIENNMSIFRAYANGYYWLKYDVKDVEYRNLGYYNNFQTELANYFKSLVIDWLQANEIDIDDKSKFILTLAKDITKTTSCIVELNILSKIIDNIPINLYDNDLHIIQSFSNNDNNNDKYNSINIKINYQSQEIYSIYYK